MLLYQNADKKSIGIYCFSTVSEQIFLPFPTRPEYGLRAGKKTGAVKKVPETVKAYGRVSVGLLLW